MECTVEFSVFGASIYDVYILSPRIKTRFHGSTVRRKETQTGQLVTVVTKEPISKDDLEDLKSIITRWTQTRRLAAVFE